MPTPSVLRSLRSNRARRLSFLLALAAALCCSRGLAQPTTPMTYHGGALMTAATNVYYIWYGAPDAAAKTVMKNFISDLSGSVWLDGATTYFDAGGKHVQNALVLAGEFTDNKRFGSTLATGQLATLINAVLSAGQLPVDANGLYVVATRGTTVGDSSGNFCGGDDTKGDFCAFHSTVGVSVNGVKSVVKMAMVGDPTGIKQRDGSACDCGLKYPGSATPNGSVIGDAMVDHIAHEIAEAATDPLDTGWFASTASGGEVTDVCNHKKGAMISVPQCTNCANVHLGAHDYLIQQAWAQFGKSGSGAGMCTQRYLRDNDVVWRESNGNLVVMRTDGQKAPTFTTAWSAVPSEWKIVGLDDFDADGYGDILWRNTNTGDVSIWKMNGTSAVQGITLASALPLSWTSVGTGDFDGNGKSDILWRNSSTGDVVLWLLDEPASCPNFPDGTPSRICVTAKSAPTLASGLASAWRTDAVSDFNGDNQADVLWRNTSTGDIVIWMMDGGSILGSSGTVVSKEPLEWQMMGAGDFDGDGKADILLRDSANNDIGMFLMDGLTVKAAVSAKSAWTGYSLVAIGDFDGNGRADVMWRNGTSGDLLTWRLGSVNSSQQIQVTTLTTMKASPARTSAGAYSDQN